MSRPRFSNLTLAMTIALIVALAAAPNVLGAAQQCVPNRSPHAHEARHVVVSGNPNGVEGVVADVLELNPYYTGWDGTGTNASIMLLDATHGYWAQLGWAISKIQDGTTVKRQIFVEDYRGASQNYYRFWTAHGIQTQTNYKIATWSQTPLYYYVDNSYIASYSNLVPTDYQVFGETHDRMDQMPGLSSNVETFRNTKWLSLNTGQWSTVTSAPWCDGTSCNSYYGKQNLGGGTYYVWDTCGSTAGAAAEAAQRAAGGTTAATTTPSDRIASADLPKIGLSTVTDVTGLAPATTYGSLTVANASQIGQAELGTSTLRLYQGTAARFPGDAVQQVWVATRSGGTAPSDGPAGMPSLAPGPVSYTGIIIDATTGEVWSGFGH